MILTHQHIDHLGLVSLVATRSGAEVAAIDAAVPFVSNYAEESEAEDDFARETMLRHGHLRGRGHRAGAPCRAASAAGAPGPTSRASSTTAT